jgi:hypothetical protein
MKIRTSGWLFAVGLGLSAAALAGACSDPPQLTKVDTDGDGFFDSQDCDDDSPNVNPNAFEDCDDGKDNDCDDKVDGADTECGANPTGGAGGADGGTGGGGDGGPCVQTCSEGVTNGSPVCPDADPVSLSNYNALIDCACSSNSMIGKCTAMCSGDFCPTKSLMDVGGGSPCQNCLLDSMSGCYTPFSACSSDQP